MEEIKAKGHAAVLGTHKTTIEVTKEDFLTPAGDCIIGINADKSCSDLEEETRKELKTRSKFTVVLKADNLEEKITGFGSPDLILTNKTDIVLRKSDYIDDRTLLINCNKACIDLDRKFIEKLKDPEQELHFLLTKSESV
ncbi:MAG: DUF371 domain-containing protein [Candidatus Undinarchaeales archaeon]